MSSLLKISPTKSKKARLKNLWFERLMAILALSNLILVFFDLSYIPMRDLYFRYIRYQDRPILTNVYDPIKGIEPNRDTFKYLSIVEALKQQVVETGVESPEAEKLLEQLREASDDMIDRNPFAVAEKTGNLEKIKNRMRDHMNNDSAKKSFGLFWSPTNLTAERWQEEIQFYDKKIDPLIAVNYFRRSSETVGFVEDFWKIDIWFVIPFALEFLARTWLISRRYAGLTWLDAMLWRWYDVFLLFPVWRWLRVIPVTVRLSHAQLLDLRAVQRQASQGLVAGIAKDVTQVVVVEVIAQFQHSVRNGEISKMLSQTGGQKYVDLNNTNEVAEIVKVITRLVVYEVLPKIRPDVEALLQYSAEKIIKNSPPYMGIAQLPGVEGLQKNLTEQISREIFQVVSDTLNNLVVEDPVFEKLIESLTEKVTDTIATEIKAKESLEKIESLLDDMFEEIKINYLERLSEEDMEKIIEQTRELRQKAQALSGNK